MGLSLPFLDSGRPRAPYPGRRARVAGMAAAGALSVAVGVAIGAMGRTQVAPEGSVEPAPSRRAAPPPARASERGSETAAAVPVEEPPAPRPPRLVTRGVSVQVLNATTARRADERMAARLRRLGFRVAATNPAAVLYERTTVFWSKRAGKRAAVALARRFGWSAAPKPRNLKASVVIHVVVGRDEAQ
jgi:hypothetical protein